MRTDRLRRAIDRFLSAVVDIIVIYTVSIGSIVLLMGVGALIYKLIRIIIT